jgi:zona occludens toxin
VESADGATATPGFVKPGDLVVADEVWKLWSTDQKLSKNHMSFFRMHRRFVHEETGVACDVILMIQSIGDLQLKFSVSNCKRD